MAFVENGNVESWAWDSANPDVVFNNYFAPYLKILKNCGKTKGCFSDTMYKNLNGKTNWFNFSTSLGSYAKLADGTSIMLRSYSGCTNSAGPKPLDKICAYIITDINGDANPNRQGVDTFVFLVTKYGIYPQGLKGQTNCKIPNSCNRNLNSDDSGNACAAWVIARENMDYLHKDIAW